MSNQKYQQMLDNFLSVAEAAKLGVPLRTVYDAIEKQKVSVFMRGSTKLVLKSDILKMLKK